MIQIELKTISFSKIDTHIFNALKFFLAVCLAEPLLASASFIFPYTTPKILAFRALVEIAAMLYFYLALKYPELRPRRTFLFWAALTFLFICLIAAVWGADFYTSFWGNLERGMGVWSLAHFVAWFLILTAVFKEPKEWRRLIELSVGVSIIVAATALIQRFGGSGELLPATDRVYGLLGNAGVLGSYLVFNIFLAGYLFFKSVGWKKWLLAGGVLFLVLNLFLTGTRGAWLGLIVGSITGFLLLFFYGAKSVKKYSAIFLITVFILAGALFLLRDTSFVQNNSALSRLTNLSFADTTLQSRLILWQGSWRAWQERPILGWGPENFEVAINKYLSPRLADYEVYGTDRAHNFIFDYGVTVGWLGLLSYLALIGVAGRSLWLKRADDFVFSAIFISILAGYLVQNLFIFDSFVSFLMLFFTLALVDNSETSLVRLPGSSARQNRLRGRDKIFLCLSALVIVAFLYFFNLKPLLAAYRASQAMSLSLDKTAQAAPLLSDALNLNTFASPEIAYQIAIDYINRIGQSPNLAQDDNFYQIASDGLSKIIERSPGRARNYIALAWLDLYFSGSNSQRINDAVDLGVKARDLNPTRKDAYLVLVAAYSLSSQPEKAQSIISQALGIDGKMGEAVAKYYNQLK